MSNYENFSLKNSRNIDKLSLGNIALKFITHSVKARTAIRRENCLIFKKFVAIEMN
jgi:hypothetical protein